MYVYLDIGRINFFTASSSASSLPLIAHCIKEQYWPVIVDFESGFIGLQDGYYIGCSPVFGEVIFCLYVVKNFE